MSDWEPATEAEAAMRDALRAGDQEHYFRLLARIDLILPVATGSPAGQASAGWGTWTTDSRTHVLAFTSPAALDACLAEHAGTFRSLPFHELAASWPDLEWWLAVNPGLPIEGYLPAWFVAQISRGDVRLPGRTLGARARIEQVTTPRSRAAEPTVPTRSRAAEPTAPVPEPTVGLSAPAGAFAADGGRDIPRRGDLLSRRGGFPQRGNQTGPEQGTANPLADRNPWVDRNPLADRGGAATVTWGGDDDVTGAAPGYARSGTSAAGFTADVGYGPSTGYSEPPPAPVAEPAPAAVSAPVPDSSPSTQPDPIEAIDFTPANRVEEGLLDAAGSGSTDSFLSTLLLAKVLVPGPHEDAIGNVNQWRTEEVDGQPHVVLFTSAELLATHVTEETPATWVKFTQLINAWPNESLALTVNPGTPVGATLPGAQIVALAAWATGEGLTDDPPEPEPQAQPEPEARRSAPPPPEPTGPIVMQKTIPAQQVPYYLDRGYDRTCGFVHRASEVSHLHTPAELYNAIGLNYSDSPFKPDDDEVYVLRWAAHRANLYRIPYGGQHEAAMRAMQGWVIERSPFRGNGFAPSESRDVIAEFKVDSVRLPHGAELWHVVREGSETLVAVFDADGPRWRRAGEE
ncbi:MAG: hypothetical protein QOE03_3105 [Micromonosporaceae bacterium]|nr:hypothetical protein [Micromonosporaceae bacterium]